MKPWVPFSLYIFPADCVLEASDCFGWKSSSWSWQVSTSLSSFNVHVQAAPVVATASSPSSCLWRNHLSPLTFVCFSPFFCLIGTQKENWKFNLPAVDCSLWCSAVLVSSCDRVRSHVVVFIVAIPPKLNINSSKRQKADQSQTDGRLVVKKIFHGKTQSAVEGNTSANRWITSCIWRPFCWQSQLSALQQMSIGQ